MSTKHLYASSDGLVLKSLQGAVRLNPALRLHPPSKSVFLASPSPSARVAVISGGGAGHEPAHASYTGRGMLAASVSGDIFASPSAKQILNTIKLAALGEHDSSSSSSSSSNTRPKDVLVIINNYTGDRLNFGLAIEQARTVLPAIKLESVVVADDVSLLQTTTSARTLVGPRGLAGNILVCKLLGALAEKGSSLNELKSFGDAVVNNLASIGVGLEHCHVPGRPKHGTTTSALKEDECEIGLGLHNEPGVKKTVLGGASLLVEQMLSLILRSKTNESEDSDFIGVAESGDDDEVVLFVNNLGGMSQLEMGAVLDEIVEQLAVHHIHPHRIYLSSFMTSLNAPGFSISILNVSRIHRSLSDFTSNIYDLLDDPTDALSWIGTRQHWPAGGKRDLAQEASITVQFLSSLESTTSSSQSNSTTTTTTTKHVAQWSDLSDTPPPSAYESAVRAACDAIIKAESDLTEFDTVLGDGDCGETFSAGAKAVIAGLDEGTLELANSSPSKFTKRLADILEDSMGGTIGALFGIFFNALSSSLQYEYPVSWPSALQAALAILSLYTAAKPGDRTLIDALHPFCQALSEGEDLRRAVDAAREGASSTKGMRATLGRAAYVVGEQNVNNTPDPGAWGVAVLLEGFWDGLSSI